MKAYLFKYKHIHGNDTVYYSWKIAKDEKTAFKFAFGKAQRKNEKIISTKRGLAINLLEIESYEVSETFPVSPIPKEQPTREVSNTGDGWML